MLTEWSVWNFATLKKLLCPVQVLREFLCAADDTDKLKLLKEGLQSKQWGQNWMPQLKATKLGNIGTKNRNQDSKVFVGRYMNLMS